jgi:predicted ATPase
MSLYSTTKGNLNLVSDIVFSIADQIKHGIDNLDDESPELRIDIAKLYELAGMQAAANSDHAASRSYLINALALLPTDLWKSHYDLSLRFSLRLAKSCYSCGDLEKAHSILGETMVQCHSLEDKLPGYALLTRSEYHHARSRFLRGTFVVYCCSNFRVTITVHVDRKSFMEAYTLCHETLSQLGEEMPKPLQSCQISEMIEATSKTLKSISAVDLLVMKEMDERLSTTMHFYSILSIAAFFGKHEMLPYVACRMTQLTLESGICKHSIIGLVVYAMVLCNGNFVKKDVNCASRIGKAAMTCSKKRYHKSEQLPQLYVVYYGFVAPHTEPLPTCADMLRQGFDAGMSLGETGIAFFNASFHIPTAMVAGNRLPTLMEKVDYYLKLANTYQNEITKTFISINRETISILIGDGGPSSSSTYAIDAPTDTENTNFLEALYYNRAIQAYWQGYSERCQHYIAKFILLPSSIMWRLHFSTFIEGMNAFQLLKRTSNGRLRSIPRNAILVLKTAASLSSWNWQNKVRNNHPHFGALAVMFSLLKHDISDLFSSAAQ